MGATLEVEDEVDCGDDNDDNEDDDYNNNSTTQQTYAASWLFRSALSTNVAMTFRRWGGRDIKIS